MVKFMKHYVTNGETKARVHYSHMRMASTGEECVTLYSKDYGNDLGAIFGTIENNTDIMTDYFEKDRVRILKSNPLYEAALARC